MFALLKFQQRNHATTFSHAFVLTIKICSPSEQSLFDLRYPIVKEADTDATFEDMNESLKLEEKDTRTVIHTDKASPNKSVICQGEKMDENSKYDIIGDTLNGLSVNLNRQDNIVGKPMDFSEDLDARIKSATTCTTAEKDLDSDNIEFQYDTCTNKSININTKNFKINTAKPSKSDHEQSLRTTKTKDEIRIKKADGIDRETRCTETQKQLQKVSCSIQKNQVFSSSKLLFTEIPKDSIDINELPVSDRSGFDEHSVEKKNVHAGNNKNSLDNKESIDKNTINSSKISYQYPVEKEIKGVKQDVRSGAHLSATELMRKDSQDNTSETKNLNEHSTLKYAIEEDTDETMREERCNETPEKNLRSQENVKQRDAPIGADDNSQVQSNSTCNKSYRVARRQKNRESERRTITDDKLLRSSNITDLVMEGLMFTIRQGRDSVAVIEQKTKLEVDEVLENSEKVETKAGEKCLLNSSLLRLENLVTMIDSSPRDKDKERRNRAGRSGAYSSPINVFADYSATYDDLYDINCVNRTTDETSISSYRHKTTDSALNSRESRWQYHREPYSGTLLATNRDDCRSGGSTMERGERAMEWKSDDDERNERGTRKSSDAKTQEKGEEEEKKKKKKKKKDLVPEVFQSTGFSCKETTAGLRDGDLPTDDMDVEETAKCDDNMLVGGRDGSSLSPRPLRSKTPAREISAKFRQANVPRVISDKAITVEQMPPALRKVLRDTCRMRKFSATAGNGPDIVSSLSARGEQQRTTQRETDVVTPERKRKSTDSDRAEREAGSPVEVAAEEAEDHEDRSRVTIDEDPASGIPENDGDARTRNARGGDSGGGRSNENHRVNSSSRTSGSPRKLQDITEDFYNDLHAHNKDSRQRRLRQRRRSSNNHPIDDAKNGRTRLEMLKFIQDMTEGAKVVVRRLNIEDLSNLLEKNSTLATCTR